MRRSGYFGAAADPGHGAVVTRLIDDDGGRRGITHRSCRRVYLDAAQVRMIGEVGHGVDFGKRDVGVGQALQQVVAGHGRKDIADGLVG
jgi:hypothetical protein